MLDLSPVKIYLNQVRATPWTPPLFLFSKYQLYSVQFPLSWLFLPSILWSCYWVQQDGHQPPAHFFCSDSSFSSDFSWIWAGFLWGDSSGGCAWWFWGEIDAQDWRPWGALRAGNDYPLLAQYLIAHLLLFSICFFYLYWLRFVHRICSQSASYFRVCIGWELLGGSLRGHGCVQCCWGECSHWTYGWSLPGIQADVSLDACHRYHPPASICNWYRHNFKNSS